MTKHRSLPFETQHNERDMYSINKLEWLVSQKQNGISKYCYYSLIGNEDESRRVSLKEITVGRWTF